MIDNISYLIGAAVGVGITMFITWLARRFASGEKQDIQDRYFEEISKLRQGIQANFEIWNMRCKYLENENKARKQEIKTIKKTIHSNEIKNDPVLYRVTEILKEYGVIKDEEDTQ